MANEDTAAGKGHLSKLGQKFVAAYRQTSAEARRYEGWMQEITQAPDGRFRWRLAYPNDGGRVEESRESYPTRAEAEHALLLHQVG
jgi:uncharacterized protein YegP (UPF0339 family)